MCGAVVMTTCASYSGMGSGGEMEKIRGVLEKMWRTEEKKRGGGGVGEK